MSSTFSPRVLLIVLGLVVAVSAGAGANQTPDPGIYGQSAYGPNTEPTVVVSDGGGSQQPPATAVPEPATLLLVGVGLALGAGRLGRRHVR